MGVTDIVTTESYKCSRGFLIERQEDGKFTPFFVKVRAIDVIDDNGYPLFPNGNINVEGMVSVSEEGGWIKTTYDDNFYEATSSIEITASTFEKTEGDDTELSCIINLPVPTTENNLNVNLTMMAIGDCMTTSFLSFRPITSLDGSVTDIRISIRNLAYTFANDWSYIRDITSSKVYVRVSGYGRIPSYIPDDYNIGAE